MGGARYSLHGIPVFFKYIIGACRPGPTTAMPGQLMHLIIPLILLIIGFIIVEKKPKQAFGG